MFKKIHNLIFKDNRFYIYKEIRIFGFLLSKQTIASFVDAGIAIKYFKSIK